MFRVGNRVVIKSMRLSNTWTVVDNIMVSEKGELLYRLRNANRLYKGDEIELKKTPINLLTKYSHGRENTQIDILPTSTLNRFYIHGGNYNGRHLFLTNYGSSYGGEYRGNWTWQVVGYHIHSTATGFATKKECKNHAHYSLLHGIDLIAGNSTGDSDDGIPF